MDFSKPSRYQPFIHAQVSIDPPAKRFLDPKKAISLNGPQKSLPGGALLIERISRFSVLVIIHTLQDVIKVYLCKIEKFSDLLRLQIMKLRTHASDTSLYSQNGALWTHHMMLLPENL